jgi:hypothetical protein
MADDKGEAASAKFELEVKIKPAKDEKPKAGNGAVFVCIIIGFLLILWILHPSLPSAQNAPGTNEYPSPAPTYLHSQAP